MKTQTFQGGIHPPTFKERTRAQAIRALSQPEKVYLPLLQHTGAPLEPLVKKGDKVKRGQKIADVHAFVAAPLHSPVAGVVSGMQDCPHPVRGTFSCLVIENDGTGEEERTDPVQADEIESRDPAFFRDWIREGGMVGLGGAAFPTHVKVTPPEGKTIDTLVINGAECEPYLTSDHRVMVERPQLVWLGARILRRACGAQKILVGIEDNKPDCITALRDAASEVPVECAVRALPTMYPQGSEKHLILSLLGREVPPGGLPLDVGVVVSNVQTAAYIGRMAHKGLPLVDRVITLTGDCVTSPANIEVPLGIRLAELLALSGGLSSQPLKIIMGGPMTGIAQVSMEIPVIKGTSGFVLTRKLHEKREYPCIRCGRCVTTCPMHLVPSDLARFSEFRDFEQARAWYALDCMECGICSYGCPSGIPLTQHIKYAKAEIGRRSRKGGK